jgi:inorganic pyrophosphatase
VTAYINASKGSLNSYVFRQDTTFRHYKYTLDMPYPGDYGMIPQTFQSGVRKPLEILILNTFPLSPECLASARIIGCIVRKMKYPLKGGGSTEAQIDYKIIGVSATDPRMNGMHTLSDLNPHTLKHFCDFFMHSGAMARCTECTLVETLQVEKACQIVADAHATYGSTFTDQTVHNTPNLVALPWGANATQGETKDRVFPAVVEASKHSSNRYGFDTFYGVLRHEGPLGTASFLPGNYGFLPQTVAEDGKPVDVVILSNVPLRTTSVAEVRVVGAAKCIDEMGPDVKIICVPKSEPRMKEWADMEDVPNHMKDEMVHFFNACKDLEEDWKFARFERWICRDEAIRYIETAHSRFFLFTMPMQRLERRVQELEEQNRELQAKVQKTN